MRRLALLLTTMVVLGCEADEPTEPSEPDYPLIAGVYDYNAPVNGLRGARYKGTITIVDASRDDPQFRGSWLISFYFGTDVVANFEGHLASAMVTEAGEVEFDLSDASWHHSGTVNGTGLSGDWVRPGSSLMGSFTAVRR